MEPPRFKLAGVVLSTPDPSASARFYERLLGWPRLMDEAGWVVLRDDDASTALSFHLDEHYRPPVWPTDPEQQQMMLHVDLVTDDLAAAVALAEECGATRHPHQTDQDEVVMIDPDGHPFCLIRRESWWTHE